MTIHLRSIAIGFLAAVLSGGRAAAQVDPWEFEVLPYAPEQRGMIELETNKAIFAQPLEKVKIAGRRDELGS